MDRERRLGILAIAGIVAAGGAGLLIVTHDARVEAACVGDAKLCGLGPAIATASARLAVGPALAVAAISAWLMGRARRVRPMPDARLVGAAAAALALAWALSLLGSYLEHRAFLAACPDFGYDCYLEHQPPWSGALVVLRIVAVSGLVVLGIVALAARKGRPRPPNG